MYLLGVRGEQQLRCDTECAEISPDQTGQFARCYAGNEDIVYLYRLKTKL